MTESLYKNYDEQRNQARKLNDTLKRASMAHLAVIRRAKALGRREDQAAHQYQLSKVLLERGKTADAVKRPTFYNNSEHHLGQAIAYYSQSAGAHNELADCYVIRARLKSAQLELTDAEQDLDRALQTMACAISACPGALRTNLLAAAGELCAEHIRNGQIEKAGTLLSRWF